MFKVPHLKCLHCRQPFIQIIPSQQCCKAECARRAKREGELQAVYDELTARIAEGCVIQTKRRMDAQNTAIITDKS